MKCQRCGAEIKTDRDICQDCFDSLILAVDGYISRGHTERCAIRQAWGDSRCECAQGDTEGVI